MQRKLFRLISLLVLSTTLTSPLLGQSPKPSAPNSTHINLIFYRTNTIAIQAAQARLNSLDLAAISLLSQ